MVWFYFGTRCHGKDSDDEFMSHSRKRTPIVGNTNGESEKWDKQKANRRMRKQLRLGLGEHFSPRRWEFSEVYSFSKDGKQWITSDCENYEKEMRK